MIGGAVVVVVVAVAVGICHEGIPLAIAAVSTAGDLRFCSEFCPRCKAAGERNLASVRKSQSFGFEKREFVGPVDQTHRI